MTDNEASVPGTMKVTSEKLDFALNNSFSIVFTTVESIGVFSIDENRVQKHLSGPKVLNLHRLWLFHGKTKLPRQPVAALTYGH